MKLIALKSVMANRWFYPNFYSQYSMRPRSAAQYSHSNLSGPAYLSGVLTPSDSLDNIPPPEK